MNRFLIFLSFVIVACTSKNDKLVPADSLKQTSADTSAAAIAITPITTDRAITVIRAAFKKINNSQLKKEQFKWTADNCNNEGTATYYFDNDNQIVKVVETGTIGDGSWTTAYYYKEGKFIFSLNTDVGGPAAGPDITTTQRKYVYNDTVIRTMENDTYTTGIQETLTPASKEYKIVEAYKSKDFGAAFCE